MSTTERISDRVRNRLTPTGMCRDCADHGPRCPNSGELCHPVECAYELAGEVAMIEQQRDELLAVLKSRPRHCEYCDDGGEGDIDIDKFIADVSAWASKARSAIKNAEHNNG